MGHVYVCYTHQCCLFLRFCNWLFKLFPQCGILIVIYKTAKIAFNAYTHFSTLLNKKLHYKIIIVLRKGILTIFSIIKYITLLMKREFKQRRPFSTNSRLLNPEMSDKYKQVCSEQTTMSLFIDQTD